MKLPTSAALLGAALLSVAMALPAEAARKKRPPAYVYYASSDRAYWSARPPTRLTVRRRSYLDPGTEVKRGDEHYDDYAFAPMESWSYRNRHNPTMTFTRQPLPDPWDIPGWPKY